MRPGDKKLAEELRKKLESYQSHHGRLPGIKSPASFNCLIEQLVESIRRNRYIEYIRQRDISSKRADPHHCLFDPIRAAILKDKEGDKDEAFWLTFLSVHFGKHAEDGWHLVRNLYGALGESPIWSWNRVTEDTAVFKRWLKPGKLFGCFGPHRRYETLENTGEVVESYIRWVEGNHGHKNLIDSAIDRAIEETGNGSPREVFRCLFSAMGNHVQRFGRLGKFDYLCLVGKLRLASIEPDSTYMIDATGPFRGAKLLFGYGEWDESAGMRRKCEASSVELEEVLGIGMQAIEDALCNWQKSPNFFKPFWC